MKIVFHSGAHKTASTHLQINLKLNKELINSKGIAYFEFKDIKGMREAANHLRKVFSNEDQTEANRHKAFIKDAINENIKGYESAIISFEGVFGTMNMYNQKDLYPDAEELIKIYKEILEGHEVTAVYAIREYEGFYHSSYNWLLKNIEYDKRYDQYIKTSSYSKNRWSQIIDALDRAFDKTRIFTIEDYKTSSKEITRRIIELTGADIKMEELVFEEKEKNVSGNKDNLNYYYTLNKISSPFGKSAKKRRIMLKIKDKLQSVFESGLMSKFLMSYSKGKIEKRSTPEDYKNEVIKIKEKFGILEKQ